MFKALLLILGLIVIILFGFLSISTGTYYLARLAEENTAQVKRLIGISTIIILVVHLGLLSFEGFPFYLIGISVLTHVIYSKFLTKFPFINFKSLEAILSLFMTIINNIIWILYLSNRKFNMFNSFSLLSLCVWSIPFAYFISLNSNPESYSSRNSRKFPRNSFKRNSNFNQNSDNNLNSVYIDNSESDSSSGNLVFKLFSFLDEMKKKILN
ncbi:tex261 protein [Anaeramoeba ignava]|uniref:Tex261 protein n=1 Tax=Anaeramoeba ignava TaxID=1746090 RepID=A0A9Q0LVE5_ANAIG|nr:tex261 protein [Anaeramoeba ignava]